MIKQKGGLKIVFYAALCVMEFGLFQGIANAAATSLKAGDVVISELMPNLRDGDVEWIEFYNATGQAIDLNDCVVADDNHDKITITQSVIIQASGYAVIGSGKSYDTNLPDALKDLAFEYSAKEFKLSTGADQVVLSCDKTLIDKVTYASYRPGPATNARGWQVDSNFLTNTANDDAKNWCYTGLPILSEENLYGKNKVASPGRENPRCAVIVLPYLHFNNQQAVLIDGIDFEQTLKIAAEELTSDYATAELTIWALRDQVITPDVAKTIADLYLNNIDKLYDAKAFTLIDWNHAVWHFAWAVANLYRNGDDAVKAQLQVAYEDAITRPKTLEKFELAATDNVLGHDILMGDAHDMGHAFALGHIVVPGDPEYVQSYQDYVDNRRSEFSFMLINLLFYIKTFFSNLFA